MNIPSHPSGSESQPKENKQRARRRFIHGVGVAVPVIMTVKSSSALAAQCFSPSAAASIALLNSRVNHEYADCSQGRTPGFWVNAANPTNGNSGKSNDNYQYWQAAGGDGVYFSTAFVSGFTNLKLKQVMALNGTDDPWQLGAHLSAAYLNNKIGWVPDTVVSLQDLRDTWAGRYGTYTPTAGVTWTGEQIVAYLQTTMPQ